MCAIEDGSVELVETLLKRGANIEACLDVRTIRYITLRAAAAAAATTTTRYSCLASK